MDIIGDMRQGDIIMKGIVGITTKIQFFCSEALRHRVGMPDWVKLVAFSMPYHTEKSSQSYSHVEV